MKKRIVAAALTLCMIIGSMLTGATAAGVSDDLPFADVISGKWYCEGIEYVYENSLMTGTSATKFEPMTQMSRAMFITVLGRLYGAEKTESNGFSDVEKNSWYSGYVGWADENGIVEGFEDNTFRPSKAISREEAATAVSRYVEYTGVILDDTDDSPEFFNDEEQISDWASLHVDRVSLAGVIIGNEKGNFSPDSSLTRAEAATMFARLHQIIRKAESATGLISAYDIINSPELFYSNMTSGLNTSGEYPEIDLQPYETHSAPWYFGTEFKNADINENALSFIKVCYKTSSDTSPLLKIESPAYSQELEPINVTVEDGYTTALFDAKETVLNLKNANLTAENPYNYNWPEDGSTILVLKNMSMRSIMGRYLRIALYPFGEEVSPTSSIRYMAFFADQSEAEAFNETTAADEIKSGRDEYSEVFFEQLTDDISAKYNREMNDRIDEILSTKNTVDPEKVTGTCYYISSIHGDDKNDGLSPETPWKSIKKLYNSKFGNLVSKLNEGDAVLFERGSVFYPEFSTNYSGNYTLSYESGVIYSSYGEGEKPMFTNSLEPSKSMDWVETDYPNVWRLKEQFPVKEGAPAYYDVGNIVFNDGEGWGIKVLSETPADPYGEDSVTVDNGVVTNGYEIYNSCSVPCQNPSVVKHNLEFFSDSTDGSLYMYYDKGNPGECFDKIAISMEGEIASGVACSRTMTVLDNLTFKYGGGGGVSTSDAINLTVQNCTIEWVGGALQDGVSTTRYGNGFQNWGSCDNIIFVNNYVNQVYDGGISTQYETSAPNAVCIMNRFTIAENVVTNTNSHIEIWNYTHRAKEPTSTLNLSIHDNYLASGGYHFGHQRPKKNGSLCYLGRFPGQTYENSVIENNIFINAINIYIGRPLLCRGDTNGSLLKNNTYIASCDTMNIGQFGGDLRTDSILSDAQNNIVKYTKENLEMLRELGIERGGKFYYFNGYLYPEEANGLYH